MEDRSAIKSLAASSEGIKRVLNWPKANTSHFMDKMATFLPVARAGVVVHFRNARLAEMAVLGIPEKNSNSTRSGHKFH